MFSNSMHKTFHIPKDYNTTPFLTRQKVIEVLCITDKFIIFFSPSLYDLYILREFCG